MDILGDIFWHVQYLLNVKGFILNFSLRIWFTVMMFTRKWNLVLIVAFTRVTSVSISTSDTGHLPPIS